MLYIYINNFMGDLKLDRGYTFHEFTMSMCEECMKLVPSQIIIKNSSVYILKHCDIHGEKEEILEEDVEFFLRKRLYDKPGTISKTQTDTNKGCPFDCGLCKKHDQHTCIGLIEITNKCNLKCPVCYADSDEGEFLNLEKIGEMMDFYQDSEYQTAEILQISGGEPTLHPDILKIIRMGKEKNIKYIMLNTNGIRIAEDEDFVKALGEFKGGFEVYLQFDGFKKQTYEYYRGKDISSIKMKALDNLIKYEIPVTLVVTVQNGINDDEIGQIVEYGLNTKYIRGINFQPEGFFGRNSKVDTKNRITLSGILKRIENQTNGIVKMKDFIPLPCNVERVAVTYFYKSEKGFIPVTRNIDVEKYVDNIENTLDFTFENVPKELVKDFNKQVNVCECMKKIKGLKKIVPFALKPNIKKKEFIDENTFRITVSYFLDAYNFDIKAMQKECVHIITPDLKKIPFSAYNMIYRRKNI